MKIEYTPKAIKEINKLPKSERVKIAKKIRTLEAIPLSGKKLKGDFYGKYTVRAWPYRIIYQIFSDSNIVYINTVEHRQGVYK